MKGYTLIEMLVAIAISSIVIIAMVRVMGTALPLYRSTYIQTLDNETARVQLTRIADEIREARPSDTGAYSIVEATGTKIVFYANVDADTATERVRYELVGNNLFRGITKPSGSPLVYDTTAEVSTIVARSIYNGGNALFTYYGKDYPLNTTPLALP